MRHVFAQIVALLLLGSAAAAHLAAPDRCVTTIRATAQHPRIVCSGVPPPPTEHMNTLLDALALPLAQRTELALRWARHYRLLEATLRSLARNDRELASAPGLLTGARFEALEALLHERSSAPTVPSPRPDYRFAEALTLSLQLRDTEALSAYADADGAHAGHFTVAFARAEALQNIHRPREAEAAYRLALDNAIDPALQARAFNRLALLARERGDLDAARAGWDQALALYRVLRGEPAAAGMAETWNHLGVLNYLAREPDQAEQAYREALRLYAPLATADAAAYLPAIAGISHNLAIARRDSGRLEQARAANADERNAWRALVELGYEAYAADLADALNRYGVLSQRAGHAADAQAAYQESLTIYRLIEGPDASLYAAERAGVLNNFGVLLRDTGRTVEAGRTLREALQLRSQLAAREPKAHSAALTQTLHALEELYRQIGWGFEAAQIADRLEKLGATQ
jgi:tetratricopeptide (TPR) repeat protein